MLWFIIGCIVGAVIHNNWKKIRAWIKAKLQKKQ